MTNINDEPAYIQSILSQFENVKRFELCDAGYHRTCIDVTQHIETLADSWNVEWNYHPGSEDSENEDSDEDSDEN
jgi:hypothetical protein